MDLEYLSNGFAITGQITADDLAELKRKGFTSVFCLRPDQEDAGQPDFNEIARAAKATGLDAKHLPVIPREVSAEDHAQFQAMLDAASGPVLAYCKTGGRAKMLWTAAQST